MAICKNEGVQQFEELELGPLIRHPLINHYFCVSSDSTAVFKISSREIISFLVEYMDIHNGKEVLVNEFLDFIANKRSVDSKEKLHVRIQSLGYVLQFLFSILVASITDLYRDSIHIIFDNFLFHKSSCPMNVATNSSYFVCAFHAI